MEFVDIGQFIMAFVLVVGLIGLLGLALRRFGDPSLRVRRRTEARLSIVEALPLDARSRLLLVRRDEVEHLLVKSGEHVRVVEAGIPAAATHDGTEAKTEAKTGAEGGDGQPYLSLSAAEEREDEKRR